MSMDITPKGGDKYGNIRGSEPALFRKYRDYIDDHLTFKGAEPRDSDDDPSSPYKSPDVWYCARGVLFVVFDANPPIESSAEYFFRLNTY